ncbi:branched-chain amino acid ABC transporter permease [Celeribacter sp. PS-C1]|uniref:branched-chain amino acid ABC transporter permease n=1 Tax=Celeribacter sp. PS-C1 TaxID=2820813 RepID=UPI001CA47354|nr:branched-chain amino acid ABC transporter permease [Celeribacter sp. PS-C1]MBW6419627.1 branched-chain amino acid ABC transporter permease [Celeribacter sp. PS-C1]
MTQTMMKTDFRREPVYIAVLALLLIAGFFLPSWLRFLLQTALAGGLVALGVAIQMRAGLVNFGQGLYYCLGGYAVGLLSAKLGITDVFVLLASAVVVALLAGALLGLLLARYREIFYAMLSLAVSMILYGVLVKAAALGSTDGFNVPPVTYLGWLPEREIRADVVYTLAAVLVVVSCLVVARYLRSGAGMLCEAVAENEIRLEYLGASPKRIVFFVIVTAAGISGLGGGLLAISTGHVDPLMTNWTTSGGFVFVALLAGRGSTIAPVIGFFLLELVQTYALDIAPNAWQMILGAVMLAAILLLPGGLWSLIDRRGKA